LSCRDKTKGRNSPSLGFPRRLAAGPQRLEVLLVTHRVHGVPETPVAVSHQLAFGGQILEWLTFKRGLVIVNVIQHAGFEDKEAAIDPAFARLPLFRKLSDAVSV